LVDDELAAATDEQQRDREGSLQQALPHWQTCGSVFEHVCPDWQSALSWHALPTNHHPQKPNAPPQTTSDSPRLR
jgi:hypothetical protein